MSTRYIVQRALTNEFLHWDLPLDTDGPEHELNGPGSLTGTLAPDVGALRAEDDDLVLEEWGSYIYEETDGEIRWGGIVISSTFSGKTWTIEAAGFATYPHGIPFGGEISSTNTEPVTVMRQIWADLQSSPDGKLGVTVVGPTTPTRLGTSASKDDDGKDVAADPYELQWWTTPDCGQEIDSLAAAGPFDYVERHYWASPTSQEIRHEITVAYPRLGKRRTDMLFEQGTNVTNVVEAKRAGDDFANAVVGLGAGEGKLGLRRTTAKRDGKLRRVAVVDAKDVTSRTRLDNLIANELLERQNTLEITSIRVHDTGDGTFATWDLGDDILVTAVIPWLGKVNLWCRITAWRYAGTAAADLTLARTDSFTYGG
jgi:hypothetical protein